LIAAEKKTKVHPKNIYALVYKGLPFIATQYGYYSAQKGADNNFYFTGDVKTVVSQRDISTTQMGFGIIGAELARVAGNKDTYVMMIDYRTGGFIHLKKIETPIE